MVELYDTETDLKDDSKEHAKNKAFFENFISELSKIYDEKDIQAALHTVAEDLRNFHIMVDRAYCYESRIIFSGDYSKSSMDQLERETQGLRDYYTSLSDLDIVSIGIGESEDISICKSLLSFLAELYHISSLDFKSDFEISGIEKFEYEPWIYLSCDRVIAKKDEIRTYHKRK